MPGKRWAAFEARLEKCGYVVEHCAHCDRSDRHPSCIIVSTQPETPAMRDGLRAAYRALHRTRRSSLVR